MYPYIKCTSCGCLLGHLYRLFQEMRLSKNQTATEADADLLDVFELLGVHNFCCKKSLMTARQFNDFLREQ